MTLYCLQAVVELIYGSFDYDKLDFVKSNLTQRLITGMCLVLVTIDLETLMVLKTVAMWNLLPISCKFAKKVL